MKHLEQNEDKNVKSLFYESSVENPETGEPAARVLEQPSPTIQDKL
jgi:hypothetical protein